MPHRSNEAETLDRHLSFCQKRKRKEKGKKKKNPMEPGDEVPNPDTLGLGRPQLHVFFYFSTIFILYFVLCTLTDLVLTIEKIKKETIETKANKADAEARHVNSFLMLLPGTRHLQYIYQLLGIYGVYVRRIQYILYI